MSIAVGQGSGKTDSLKCFTYEQAKTILIDLKRLEYCDSANATKDTIISNYKQIEQNQSVEIKNLKKNNFFKIGITGLIGLILGILIS